MGIFDFFRKKKTEEIVIEKLKFSEIKDWIEKKKIENESKEKDIIIIVKEKNKNFIKELKEKIILLENFDIETKKEEDRIKNIVADSRTKYIESVNELIEKLNLLEETKLEKLTEKIDRIFLDFNKQSFKNYERTTILVGKEMASIKESLKLFSTELLRIFNENKSVISSFKNLLVIKEKLNAVTPIDQILEEIIEKKSNLDKQITKKKQKHTTLKQNLEEIKISHVYLENLNKQKKIESLREESKAHISELKQLLDFKALASFFHINPEQMKTVQYHRDDFHKSFEQDNGQIIIELLDEAKLNNNSISEKINQIRTKREETENHRQNLKDDGIQEIHLKIKDSGFEIENLIIEKSKQEKRDEKLKINKQELTNTLKQGLAKLNIEIVS